MRTDSAPARSCRASPTATSCFRPRSTTTSRRCSARSRVGTDDPAFTEAEANVADSTARMLGVNGHPLGRPLPPRARQDHVGQLRHGAQRREPRQGARRDPRAARGVLVRRPRARRRRELQPEPGEGRPRRRLPRVRRAARPRRPPPRGVAAAGTSASSTRPRKARRCVGDDEFAYVAAWEWAGVDRPPTLHKEPLSFDHVHLAQRSYK